MLFNAKHKLEHTQCTYEKKSSKQLPCQAIWAIAIVGSVIAISFVAAKNGNEWVIPSLHHRRKVTSRWSAFAGEYSVTFRNRTSWFWMELRLTSFRILSRQVQHPEQPYTALTGNSVYECVGACSAYGLRLRLTSSTFRSLRIAIFSYNRAVYTGENKPRIRQSAAYLSRELGHLYEHGSYKKLVRSLRKPRTCFLCRLYEQFAANKPRIV